MEINSLDDVFQYLNNESNYKEAVKRRICKIILGSSVIRVFKENTKTDLMNCLMQIDVKSLYLISSQKKYDAWHKKKITTVYNCLLKNNNRRFKKKEWDGLKWGHATKIFNLYIGHLMYYSPYFSDTKYVKRLYSYLHVPLDSKAFSVLKSAGIKPPSSIKSINEFQYIEMQDILRKAASAYGMAPIIFDEYAWAVS